MLNKLTFTAVNGSSWVLIDSDGDSTSPVFVVSGGLEGLSGAREPVTVQVPGRGGQRVVKSGTAWNPMEGVLHLAFVAPAGANVAETWRQWCAAWMGGGILTAETTTGVLYTPVRINAPAVHSVPQQNPGRTGSMLVDWPVVCDDGVWHLLEHSEIGAEIENWGVTVVSPWLVWGPSKAVVVVGKSGSKPLRLPTVSGVRRVSLDVADNFIVLDEDGNVDRKLWEGLRNMVRPLVLAPGDSAQVVPTEWTDGQFRVEWEIGVADLWSM